MRTHAGGLPGRDDANAERQVGRLRRSVRRDVPLLASALLVLLGLLAMHGFQAASSPAGMSGVPLASMAAGHAVPVTEAVTGHRPPQGDRPGDHHSDRHSDRHSDHPGGQVCLAMLTLLALALALLALRLRRPPPVAVSRPTRVRIPLVGRPPPRPSLHRLSVLRL